MRRLLLLVLCLCNCAWAQPVVHKFSTDLIKRSDGGDVYVNNDYGVEVTVTITAELKNMSPSEPLPYTVTVPPHRRMLLISFDEDDPSESWHYSYKTHWCWGNADAVHDDSVVYRLPFEPGEGCVVLQGYKGRFSHYGDNNYALDFSMPDNTPVFCAREGVVGDVESGYVQGGRDKNLGGNYVLIRHNDGTMAEYFHLRPGGVVVREGQPVAAGDLLGYSGHTGYADGPHLHFMVFRALDGYHRQSIPTLFQVEGESIPVQLRQGRLYRRPRELVPVP